MAHPKLGFSWKGFAIEQIVRRLGFHRDVYRYRTQAAAELDLLVIHQGKRFGFECKVNDAPQMTKSMHVALAALKRDHLLVVHPGEESYSLHDKASALALGGLTGVPGLLR